MEKITQRFFLIMEPKTVNRFLSRLVELHWLDVFLVIATRNQVATVDSGSPELRCLGKV